MSMLAGTAHVCKIIFEKILEDEGVCAVNELAEAVKHFRTEEQWDKLAAVAELTDVSDSKSLIKLAGHLNSFDFIPEVQDQEDLAKTVFIMVLNLPSRRLARKCSVRCRSLIC